MSSYTEGSEKEMGLTQPKPLSLFLRDGKLFGAFLPEKPDELYFSKQGNDKKLKSYERSKSEALSQAMECVNPELLTAIGIRFVDDEWKIKTPTNGFYGEPLKEGEFYTWEGQHCIVEKYCGGKNCPGNDGCWGGSCMFPNKSIKLLPMSNVTFPDSWKQDWNDPNMDIYDQPNKRDFHWLAKQDLAYTSMETGDLFRSDNVARMANWYEKEIPEFAVRFAEWVVSNDWFYSSDMKIWVKMESDGKEFTTSELMEIFKQQPK